MLPGRHAVCWLGGCAGCREQGWAIAHLVSGLLPGSAGDNTGDCGISWEQYKALVREWATDNPPIGAVPEWEASEGIDNDTGFAYTRINQSLREKTRNPKAQPAPEAKTTLRYRKANLTTVADDTVMFRSRPGIVD